MRVTVEVFVNGGRLSRAKDADEISPGISEEVFVILAERAVGADVLAEIKLLQPRV